MKLSVANCIITVITFSFWYSMKYCIFLHWHFGLHFDLYIQHITFQQVVGLVPRLHWHPRVAKYTCVYDMQLLAIWRIPLLAVVLLFSLALHVGLLRTLSTSPCLSRFRNDRLERRTLCIGLFSQVCLRLLCTLPAVAPPPPRAHARVIFYLQWPGHIWNAGAASGV